MVLHNDKWARKAKKAVERRKGINSSRGRGRGTMTPTIERLDMNRPVADTDEQLISGSGSSDDSSSSFEFDSGDEGKFVDADQVPSVTSEQSALQANCVPVKGQQRPILNQPSKSPPALAKNSSIIAQSGVNDYESKTDKRFARRKLVDNSSRYEEPVLDPYLVIAEPEPEIDYHTLGSRQFTNPNEVELVPDERSARRTPQMMEDTTHFEKLKQMQQKEEYARDMKRRFGQRSGFARTNDQNAIAADDDDFFSAVDTGNNESVNQNHKAEQNVGLSERQRESSGGLEHMEKFLDDLLKI